MESAVTAAEKRLEELLSRVTLLEKSGGAASGSNGEDEVKKFQAKTLTNLRELRGLMKAEGSSIEDVKAQLAQTTAERDELRKQVDRLNYRILHLLRALEGAEDQNK